MNPVTTALQTIAAIQGETRERHVDAASRYSTEPVHSQSLSASSLSIGRDRRTAASAKGKSDCGLGQRVEVPPTAQAKTSAPEAALAREIRIDKRDRVVVAPAVVVVVRVQLEIGGAHVAVADGQNLVGLHQGSRPTESEKTTQGLAEREFHFRLSSAERTDRQASPTR